MAIETLYPVANAESVALTFTSINSLASSASLGVAESAAIDNRTNKDLNHIHHGTVNGNASNAVTANTQINFYVVIPTSIDSSGVATWPDVFDGTDSAETISTQAIKNGCCKQVCTVDVTEAGTNLDYPYNFDIASYFGGVMPPLYVVVCQQNTGQAFAASGHVAHYTRVQAE